jgi:hypothetical protein
MKGVIVAVAEKDEPVEGVGRPRRMLHERRACRALAVQPRELIADGVRPLEDRRRVAGELRRVAGMRHGEPSHRHATDRFDTRRQRIGPRDVVLRAGGEYLDLGVTRQMFSDVARMQLGAAVDVGAVPLCDDRNLHDALEPESDGGSTLAGWGVAVAADGSTTRCGGSGISARGSTFADSDAGLAGDGSTPGA